MNEVDKLKLMVRYAQSRESAKQVADMLSDFLAVLSATGVRSGDVLCGVTELLGRITAAAKPESITREDWLHTIVGLLEVEYTNALKRIERKHGEGA